MPKPKPRLLQKPVGAYHHGNLRRALLDATLQLLGEEGPDTFSLREVARRVGVDHRAAYKHFEDRAALLAALATEGYEALLAAVRGALAGATTDAAGARLIVAAQATMQFAVDHAALYRLMSGPRLNEGSRFPALEQALLDNMVELQREISRGVASHEFVELDVLEASIAFWAALSGLIGFVLSKRVRVKRERLADFTARAMSHSVRGFRS
ncbi:MAG TPA: TetR/AcrR family transcriptional regulator [Polyangiales bacterium]